MVCLVDLLDEAVLRVKESLEERIKENEDGIAVDYLPETIGYGTDKYFHLR